MLSAGIIIPYYLPTMGKQALISTPCIKPSARNINLILLMLLLQKELTALRVSSSKCVAQYFPDFLVMVTLVCEFFKRKMVVIYCSTCNRYALVNMVSVIVIPFDLLSF